MAHKRSKNGKHHQHERQLYNVQRSIVQEYIFQTSFNDKIIHEIVETESPEGLDKHLKSQLSPEIPQVYYAANDGWRDGLVLVSQLQYAVYQNMVLYPAQLSWVKES
jgi:hypothetical protein